MEDRTVIQLGSPGSVRAGVRLNGMYEVETLIAQGGMGEVYKGFNIQTHDPVAIKMILPELARNPDAFALFKREASTLHNLQHEAIVRYFVFSVDPDLRRAYLAMEFVDGPSLTKRLTQGPLTLAEATILRKRIAGALEAAHRFDVIHRDISSDNVILPGNDPRRAKIIDFGIARSQRPGEGTLVGDGFAGKYNYVSPEQLGLAGGDVTAKSDIYSFGLVLAEALRGRPIDMNGTQVEIIEKRRSVPDLSGIDPSIRPLLQAMLQPLPADRPESMAAVAAWGEGGGDNRRAAQDLGSGKRARAAVARPEGGSSAGRLAAILGLLIVIVSVGGTLYIFRDEMPWNKVAIVAAGPAPKPSPSLSSNPSPSPRLSSNLSPSPNQSPSESHAPAPAPEPGPAHKLPPLPDFAASPANVAPSPPADNSAPATAASDIKAPSPPPAPHAPSADEIVQSLNQLKQQKPEVVASNPPGAGDVHPGAEVAAPAKLSKSIAEPKTGAPAPAPLAAAEPAPAPPVATPAPAAAPPAPPRAPQALLTIADAAVGKDYEADLPPFSDSGGATGLVLHTEPNPPEGLTFADLGSGWGQISGKPSRPGQYSFDIIARNSAGSAAHMMTRINIAPAPPAPAPPSSAIVVEPSPQPPAPASAPPADTTVAAISPGDKAAAFVSGFDGGSCFLARTLGGAGDSIAIQGIGSDKAMFQRFYNAFIHEIGVEPALTVRLIGAAECPAVGLIRASGSERSNAPKIQLAGYDVGHGKPLAGTVSNLSGRHLDLLLASSDGQVYRVDARPQPGGAATFSAPITPDVASIEALQLLIAIVSPKPLHALEGFKAGAAADILPRLRGELARGEGSLEVEFFKLVK